MSRFTPLEDIAWRTIGGRLLDNVPVEIDEAQHERLLAYLSETLTGELRERVVPQQLPDLRQLLREMTQDPAGHLVSQAAIGTAQLSVEGYPDTERLYREVLLAVAEQLGGGSSGSP